MFKDGLRGLFKGIAMGVSRKFSYEWHDIMDLQIYLFSPDEIHEKGRNVLVYFVDVNFSYVNLIMFNKVLLWIFVWLNKTGKKSFPFSKIFYSMSNKRGINKILRKYEKICKKSSIFKLDLFVFNKYIDLDHIGLPVFIRFKLNSKPLRNSPKFTDQQLFRMFP